MVAMNAIVLAIGGVFLLGALGRGAARNGESPALPENRGFFGLGGGATSFGTTGTQQPPLVFGGTQQLPQLDALLAGSADEDIGIEPIPALNFSPPREDIFVGSVNTPVLAQEPRAVRVPVTIGGGFAEGFFLTGAGVANIAGDTALAVAAGSPISSQPFSTTPDVLTRYLNEVFNQSPAPNAGNTFDLQGALAAEAIQPSGAPGELEGMLRAGAITGPMFTNFDEEII